MSGGHFEYNQRRIRDIHEQIQEELEQQGREKPIENIRWHNEEYFEKYPEERFHIVYREDIQKIFKEGIEALKIAEIYAQRIDWYLSGDDGEESLISRLKEDLDNLNK